MASKVINTILNLKDNFSNSLKKTTENTKEFKRQTREAKATISGFKRTAADGFKAVGVAALAGTAAMAAIGKQALDLGDELQKTADVTGFTVERVQELSYVGENVGVSFETLSGANSKLIKSMSKANDGAKSSKDTMLAQKKAVLAVKKAQESYNTAVIKHGKDSTEAKRAQLAVIEAHNKQKKAFSGKSNAFSELGVKITNSSGKLRDSKVVFEEVVEKLSKMKNETERNAMSMKIFGKSAMELNPLIKAGSKGIKEMTDEFRNSGAELSGDQVAALDTFGDTIGSLGLQFKGLGAQLAVQFLPELQSLLDKVKATDFKPMIAQAKQLITEVFQKMGDAIKWVKDNFYWLEPAIAGVVTGFAAFKIISTTIELFNAFKIVTIAAAYAQGGLNAAFLACPLTWIVVGIGAVVAAGILLYKNWDEVSAKGKEMWANTKDAFTSGINNIIGMIDWLIKKINLIPGIKIPLIAKIGVSNRVTDETKNELNGRRGKTGLIRHDKNALGTPYFKGGLTSVNERGGEIIDLPSGSRVIPADKSAKMMQGGGIQVIVQIAGNVIGNEEFADYCGDVIAKKLQFALVKG